MSMELREYLLFTITGISLLMCCEADTQKLFDVLFSSNYTPTIRPRGDNQHGSVLVSLDLKLLKIVDVDEKNQILVSNVVFYQQWNDSRLTWNPDFFGGIRKIHVSLNSVWRPDILVWNSADDDFAMSKAGGKVTLSFDGRLVWRPLVTLHTQCFINVKYFPFDDQRCSLRFGSWVHSGYEIDLNHMRQDPTGYRQEGLVEGGVDLVEFYRNTEWSIIYTSGEVRIIKYPCCAEYYPDIIYIIHIRRKPLFYYVNLIIPCVIFNFLTCTVFMIPHECGEKISFSISMMMILSVFQLYLMELMPATSVSIPIVGKYIMFTVCVVVLSVLVAVITINISRRSQSTHAMPYWIRIVFMRILPTMLFVKIPDALKQQIQQLNSPENEQRSQEDNDANVQSSDLFEQKIDLAHLCEGCVRQGRARYPTLVKEALEGIDFIAEQRKASDTHRLSQQGWKFVAMVIDRLFLVIYMMTSTVWTFDLLFGTHTQDY